MSVLTVYSQQGKKIKDLNLNSELFEGTISKAAVYECVKSYQAAQRQGNASTKTRGQVNASSVKPWKQKGTGRARAGSRKSPLWRGGAILFGPQPRDYGYRLSKKTRRAGLLSVLRNRYQDEKCVVVDALSFPVPKTKEMLSVLNKLKVGANVLVVTQAVELNVLKSSSNLPKVQVKESHLLNALDVIGHDYILFTEQAILDLEKRLIQQEA